MKPQSTCFVLALIAVAVLPARADVLLRENFESPSVSGSSASQHGATYAKGTLPNNGKWIGSTQGFGADRKGLIHKTFGDYNSSPSGNQQGIYFAYTNTGITTSAAAISHVLEAGVTYAVSFDVARDNNQAQSSYLMELVAFTSAQGDSVRNDVRPGSKPGNVLASASGTVTTNDLTKRVRIVFTPNATTHAAHLGKNLGLRFIGNSTCPILDNVTFTTIGSPVGTDSDSDGMNDAWETASFGDLTHDGTADTDGDSLTDLFEFQANLEPTDTDTDGDGHADWIGVYGYLGVEQWNNIAGATLDDLIASPAFYGAPSIGYFAPRAQFPGNSGDDYGLRMSGTVIAPVSGTYRFWLASDGPSRLSLSADATPFSRRRIATVETATAPEGWDENSSQQSAAITLVAGQEYFIEVLMKESTGADHVAVAWDYTGQTRQVIPGAFLKSFVPNANDADQDGMLDSWESQVGLDPADNGATDLAQSGYANPDNDDLLNHEEYLYGRNPLLADTPGGQQGYCEWQQFTLGNNNGLVSALTSHPSFAQNQPASQGLYAVGAEAPANAADYYGRRMRGVILIPVTGTYHFYVTGDDSARLLINPAGPSRFGKQIAAICAGPAPVKHFTTYPSQKSPAYQLTQGDRVYFEALQVDNYGADHLSVAWSGPIAASPAVIPAAYLSTCQPETIIVSGQTVDNDIDNDSLPDDWETSVGLLVTNAAATASANGEFGDPDGDGLTNREEYQIGTNPITANGIASKWRHEIYHGSGQDRIADLIGTSGILKGPTLVRLADSTEDLQNYGDGYGQRFRATLTPAVSGDYTFWVAGDDSVELWLSTDDRKFSKRRLAFVDDASFSGYSLTGFRQWDRAPGQRSAPVTLAAGQSYYIEVLHQEWGNSDHVSVAWSLGGHTANRVLLPPSVLTSFIRDADDLDDDCLVDTWENQYISASASSDNGRVNPGLGEYGDPDGDLIINRDEWLLGTHPNNPDTDGDGYADGQEVYFLGTNPLVPELTNPQVVGEVQIDAIAQSSGTWVPTADGGMLSMENRGWIDYNISIAQQGYYLFEIRGCARGSAIFPKEDFGLDFLVDSRKVASTVLTSLNGEQGMAAGFAGWLAPGNHTLRIWNKNLLARRALQLDSIRLVLPSGPSSTVPGLPDWVYDFLSARATINNASGGSLVSPVCLEGGSRDWAATTISVDGGTPDPVEKGADDGWFANVDLDPAQTTEASIRFENGVFEETLSFDWLPFNAASGLPMTLRAGDSLRLTAHTVGGLPDGSAVSFILNGQSIGATTADVPLVHTFAAAGEYTLEASYIGPGGTPATASVAIDVIAADFGPAFPLYLNRSRVWNLPNVPAALPLEADSSVIFGPESPLGTGRSFVIDVTRTGTNTVLARTIEQGPVVASGAINGLLLSKSGDGESAEVFVYPNGDRIVEMTMFATSLPPGGYIRMDIYLGGRLFLPNGTTSLTLTAADFDEAGIARFRVLLSSGVGHACHRTYVYDAHGNLVGQM